MITVLMYVAYGAFGLISLLMVFAILLQEGKGGGLSALGGTQAESAFGASNPIRRATVVLAIIFFLLSGTLTYIRSSRRVRFDEDAATEASEDAAKPGEAEMKPDGEAKTGDAPTEEKAEDKPDPEKAGDADEAGEAEKTGDEANAPAEAKPAEAEKKTE